MISGSQECVLTLWEMEIDKENLEKSNLREKHVLDNQAPVYCATWFTTSEYPYSIAIGSGCSVRVFVVIDDKMTLLWNSH